MRDIEVMVRVGVMGEGLGPKALGDMGWQTGIAEGN